MWRPKLTQVFTVRIVYKSGYTHDFDVEEFTIKNGDWKWKSYRAGHRPLDISVGGAADNIAAVWQLRSRYVLQFT